MTAADPRDGLPELPRPTCTYADHSYPAYTASQMRAYAQQCIAHARPEAVDSLAADQQKGGGEVVLPEHRPNDLDPEGFDNGWNCCLSAVRKALRSPQPSIPAPAQQDGKASGGEVAIAADEDMHTLFRLRENLEDLKRRRWRAKDWDVSDAYVNANIGHAANAAEWALPALNRVLGVLLDNAHHRAALAHPPHANQETQG